MKQIGFKNFRKFADFPPLDLAPITILVGENNAGKSTVVKGILAFSDFLNECQNYDDEKYFFRYGSNSERKRILKERLKNVKFYFNTSYLAHIGTFKRALYNKATDESITFQSNLGLMDVTVQVIGKREDEEAVSGNVSMIKLYFDLFKMSFSFDLMSDIASVTFNPCPNYNADGYADRYVDGYGYRSRYDMSNKGLKEYFASFTKPYTVTTRISDNWSPYRSELIGSLLEALETSINATLYPFTEDTIEKSHWVRLPGNPYYATPINDMDDATKAFLRFFAENILQEGISGSTVPNRFRLPGTRGPMMRMVDIEYLYAHAVSQTVIYSAKDTNDYLSRTIHEFASQQRYSYKKDFIIKWMKEFGIGTDFSIRSVGGEAHIVYITNKDGEIVNLADKGMGSIQLMILFFRLAISLPQKDDRNIARRIPFNGKIIIIEEPEQNLHPMLQSKLADFFYELNTIYGFRFIIETHSEYLVRSSQVIVGENFNTNEKLKKNPFKVYYFPSEGVPYDMVYTTSGLFEKKFGGGFINEAGKLHMAVLKNAQKQK